jgi:hypothetical protein
MDVLVEEPFMRSRFAERAELAEKNLKNIEDELQLVGENMKQLELSAEKAVEREEKLKDKILQIQYKYKTAEGRYVCLSTHEIGGYNVVERAEFSAPGVFLTDRRDNPVAVASKILKLAQQYCSSLGRAHSLY